MSRNYSFAVLLFASMFAPEVAHLSWDVTTPAGSEAKSMGDDRIREMKVDVTTALDHEGVFPGADTSSPRFVHVPSTGTTANRPTSNDRPVGKTYINTSSTTWEMYNGSDWQVLDVVASSGITASKLHGDTAGDGLKGGAGTAYYVSVDSSTVELNSDALRVKAGGIGSNELAAAVDFTSVESDTYTWNSFGVLPILQLLDAAVGTSSATTSASFVPTNITLSITPKQTDSRILVIVCGSYTQAAGASGYITIGRNGSSIAPSSSGYHGIASGTVGQACMVAVDIPATTSATTYAAMFKTDSGVALAFPASTFGTVPSATITAVEIGH